MCVADIDECQDGTDRCDQNAACTNSISSHLCECVAGYMSTGDVVGEVCNSE